jgi:hypothetical protein
VERIGITMVRKIYKYNLEIGENITEIKACEKLLSVDNQNGNIVLYAMVNDVFTNVDKYKFLVVGTGWCIIEDMTQYKFLGTVNQYDMGLMFHVFYKVI